MNEFLERLKGILVFISLGILNKVQKLDHSELFSNFFDKLPMSEVTFPIILQDFVDDRKLVIDFYVVLDLTTKIHNDVLQLFKEKEFLNL